MISLGFNVVLLRVIIPVLLLFASILRYNFFSFIYLLFFLASPFLKFPRDGASKVSVQVYLIVLVAISCIFSLSHATLYLVIAATSLNDSLLSNCSREARIASAIGIEKLGTEVYRALRLVMPDPVVLLIAILALAFFTRTVPRPGQNHEPDADIQELPHSQLEEDGASRNGFHQEGGRNSIVQYMQDSRTTFHYALAQASKLPNIWILHAITVVLVAAAGVIVPSMLSAFYLLSFYVTCTYWSSCRKVYNHKLAWTRIVLIIYSALHLCLLYLYQFEYAQSILPEASFTARFLGLNYLVRSNCSSPGELIFPTDKPLFVYFSPLAILLVYMAVTFQVITHTSTSVRRSTIARLLRSINVSNSHRHAIISRQRELEAPIDTDAPSIRLNESLIPSYPDVAQLDGAPEAVDSDDPTTTETLIPVPTDGNNAHSVVRNQTCPIDGAVGLAPIKNASAVANTSQPVYGFFPFMVYSINAAGFRSEVGLDTNNNFLSPLTQRSLLMSCLNSAIRNSYILTFIAMMAWSVIFRSWLSFILLLSACILWILPNSRLACLYCSPLIVTYGMCIILLQYIYCFNLTEAELPTYLPGHSINLTEVGLHRWSVPVGPLSLQLMFLVFFWLNLRLFVLERDSRRQIRHVATTPSPNTVNTAGSGVTDRTTGGDDCGGDPPNPPAAWGVEAATAIITPASLVPHLQANIRNQNEHIARVTSAQALDEIASNGFAVVDNAKYRRFASYMRSLCLRYWIALCCLTMLLLSLRRPVVIFRVIYMVLLLYFFTVFMVNYRFWRKQMLGFWWVYVIYSIAVLLCTYTYQFTAFPRYWQNGTGLSPQILKAIGLEQFDNAVLFDRLMMPVAFMVVIILQMHYFHKPFLQISSLGRYRDTVTSNSSRINQAQSESSRKHYTESFEAQSNFMEDVHSVFNLVASSLYRLLEKSKEVAWRLAEVYGIRVVCLLVVVSVIKEVTITNIIPVIVVAACFPFPGLHGFLSTFVFCFTGLQIIMKMLFQLDIISDADGDPNRTSGPSRNPTQPKTSITSLLPNGTGKWIGLDVVDDFPKYITPLATLIVVCVCWHAIRFRQMQHYRKTGAVRPKAGIIFPEMSFAAMDEKIVNFLKCIVNYTFYKIGLEICFCVTVIAACIRVDALSVLYLLLMLIFLFTHRHVCARVWAAYMTFLGVLLVVQYAACSQIPSILVESLPWDSNSNETIRLQQWLFLPSTSHQPDPRKLYVDFLQFMLVAMQWRVFKLEKRADWGDYGGGSNKPILTDTPPGPEDRDFIGTKESYLDYLRHGVFYWSYWLSLAIVFATGVSWITIFCLGYMILSFIYLWMGQNVLMRKRADLIASWNVIVGYNFFVILAKCSLQLMGCVYWNRLADSRICWLIQLFGITCMDPVGWNNYYGNTTDIDCEIVSNGLHWDVVCFSIIILQRKIFTTSSFRHVVFDLNVQSCFASRGAFLINRKLMQAISEQNMREKHDLERVQHKLDKIAQRQKELGKNTANINEHYILIRSGDYYHFEGDPEEEEDKEVEELLHKQSPSHHHSSESDPIGDGGAAFEPDRRHPSVLTSAAASKTKGHIFTAIAPAADASDSLQRRHISSAWSNIDSAPLDSLSNYTCPYGAVQPKQPVRQSLISATGSQSRRRGSTPHTDSGHGMPPPRSLHQQPLRHLSSSSSEEAAFDSSGFRSTPMHHHHPRAGRLSYQTHRRLSSYPEAFLAARMASTNECKRLQKHLIEKQQQSIELQAFQKSPIDQIQLSEQQAPTIATHGKHRKTFGHRRIASAGAIDPSMLQSEANMTSGAAEATKVRGREACLAADSDSQMIPTSSSAQTNLMAPASHAAPQRPSVTFAPLSMAPDPGTFADDDGTDYTGDEDDANPTQTTHMNPLQLINQAMEHGVRSTARHYRRTLAFYQQKSFIDSAVLETDARRGRPSIDGRVGNIVVARTCPKKAVLSRQGTFDGSDGVATTTFEEDPLLTLNVEQRAEYSVDDADFIVPRTEHRTSDASLLPEITAEDSISRRNLDVNGEKGESCWSRFKAGCLVLYIFILSTIETTTRMLNTVTREHRRIRRTIDLEKRKVKQKALAIVSRNAGEARPFIDGQLSSGSTSENTSETLCRLHTKSFLTKFHRTGIIVPPGGFRVFQPTRGSVNAEDVQGTIEHVLDSNKSNIVDGVVADGSGSHRNMSTGQGIEKFHIPTRVNLESVVLEVISGNSSLNQFAADPPAPATKAPRTGNTHNSTGASRPPRSSSSDTEPVKAHSDQYSDAEYAILVPEDEGTTTTVTTTAAMVAKATDERERDFRRSRPSLFLLLIAVGNLIVVHSELVCYAILILNNMRSANVLSMIYPLMVFLWGMLSVPRPTKNFWISLITYTELVIIIKYIFQFRVIDFNSPDALSATLARTHWLPAILGIEKTDSYATWDLIQLLFVFLHRSYLKNYGLWRDDTEFRQDLQRAVEANKTSAHSSSVVHAQGSREDPTAHSKTVSAVYGPSSSLNPIVKMGRFYMKMTDPRYNQKVDVYVFMFICEFLAFWIIIFGYQSFGPSTGMGDNAFEFIKTNRIPGPFIGMIIIQSAFIIMDRALFLRKQVLGKFIFQILHVILIHVWLFFLLPQITFVPFNVGSARALLYMIKCIYFGLSAYQIRSGYPRHISGNFLTKNYNYINLVLFKAYLITPFLYEVRSVMDWMWTDSPLSLYHWMELEDIYAKVFVMKCWRRSEIEYPTALGQKRSICVKYTVGLLILLFAFVCFWGPLVVGSFIDTTFAINVPIECSQTLAIGGFPALFYFTSRENNLLPVADTFLSEIRQCNALDQRTSGFVDNFKTEDVSNMTFSGISESVWSITPPMYLRLIEELNDINSTMTMTFHAECRRPQKEVDSSSQRVEQFFNRPLSAEERLAFLSILSKNSSENEFSVLEYARPSVKLDLAFPRFLFAQKNNLRNASGHLAKPYTYVNVSASLRFDPASTRKWWVFEEIGIADVPCYGSINNLTDAQMSFHSPNRSLSIIIFNERVSDNILGKMFSSYGIIGMYAAYIFVASRLLRMIYSDISYQISLQELPHVDRLLNLCHDIYLVRENGKLRLEEQLFAKLVFLYRSSETMIKWTRHPKWLIDKFTDNPENGDVGEGGGSRALALEESPTTTITDVGGTMQPRAHQENSASPGRDDGSFRATGRGTRSTLHASRIVVPSGDPRTFRSAGGSSPASVLRHRAIRREDRSPRQHLQLRPSSRLPRR